MARKLEGASHIDAWSYGPEELHRIREVLNLRHGLRNIEELAGQIAKDGQLQLGLVRINAQGEPVLIAGHRRAAAIRLINEDPSRFGLAGPLGFNVRVKKATDEEAIELNLSENLDRDDLSPVDKAFAARQLEEILGWDRKRIAARLRVGESRISGLLTIFEHSQRIINLIHEGRIKEAQAKHFKGLPEEQINAFADRIEAGEKPAKVVAETKEAHRSAGSKKARTLAEARTALKEAKSDRAFNLLCWLDGDPTVSLDEVLR
jgi:ParB/RepB/Spo0J family partition protein